MTLAQILRALARRWYVLFVGVALTAGAGLLAAQGEGVYTARTSITLTPPAGWAVAGNAFTDSAASLVGFAKVIEQTLSGEAGGQLFANAGTPLYGSGIREGELVYVPNFGGQWAPNFSQPVLIIDVVGPTAEHATARVEALTADIADAVAALQDEQGVVADQRITWYASPASPEVSYVGPDRVRSLGGIALLGGGVTIAAALVLDLILRRRHRGRD